MDDGEYDSDSAGEDRVVKLHLASRSLTTVPGSIAQYANLRELNLARNQLTSLAGLESLLCLEVLNAYFNKIQSLSEVARLAANPRLASVDLRLNPVAAVVDYRCRAACLIGASLTTLDRKRVREEEYLRGRALIGAEGGLRLSGGDVGGDRSPRLEPGTGDPAGSHASRASNPATAQHTQASSQIAEQPHADATGEGGGASGPVTPPAVRTNRSLLRHAQLALEYSADSHASQNNAVFESPLSPISDVGGVGAERGLGSDDDVVDVTGEGESTSGVADNSRGDGSRGSGRADADRTDDEGLNDSDDVSELGRRRDASVASPAQHNSLGLTAPPRHGVVSPSAPPDLNDLARLSGLTGPALVTMASKFLGSPDLTRLPDGYQNGVRLGSGRGRVSTPPASASGGATGSGADMSSPPPPPPASSVEEIVARLKRDPQVPTLPAMFRRKLLGCLKHIEESVEVERVRHMKDVARLRRQRSDARELAARARARQHETEAALAAANTAVAEAEQEAADAAQQVSQLEATVAQLRADLRGHEDRAHSQPGASEPTHVGTTRQGEAADGGSLAYAASPLRAPRSAPVTGTAASTGDQQQPSRVAYDALAASNDHLRRELAALRRTQQAQARQWRRNFSELRQRYESAVGAYGTVMPAPAAVRDSV